jgi:hypothetical protein
MGTASGCVCVYLALADGSSGSQSICMHSEELQTAATKGDTKTVVALLARGADVHCKTNDGYGFSRLPPGVVLLATMRGGRSVHPGGLLEWLFSRCRKTVLHWASLNGHTETAMALVKAGADVRCKDNDGYGFSCCIGSSGIVRRVRCGRSVHSEWSCSCRWAVQVDGAALGVIERPHGDGDCAGQGGRGRALQDQRRVRFLEAASSRRCVGYNAGRTVRALRTELQEWLVSLCRNTALHLASLNGHTETATTLAKAGADAHCKNNMGYRSRAVSLCRRFVTPRGGCSVHSG